MGFAIGTVGFGLCAAVLVTGGGYFLVDSRLTMALSIAVAGFVAGLVAAGIGRRSMNVIMWLAVVAFVEWGWNFVAQWLRWRSTVWSVLLPLVHPAGIDFRDGLYGPAQSFSTATSGWPPLTLLLGRPFTLVSFASGYAIQVCILTVLALVASILSATLASKAACSPDESGECRAVSMREIAFVMGFWLLTSYGFMYEVERGNIDLYALVFSLLSVWLLIRCPRNAWPAATCLAVAVGLKLYPAALLVVLAWRYRWRAVVPAIVTTLVALLAGGPANLRRSLDTLGSMQASPTRLGWLNGSAAAMAHQLRATGAPDWILYPLLLVPLALWGGTLLALVRKRMNDRRIILAAASCTPVMMVIPSISNDYKLVLCVFPLAVMSAVMATMRREPEVVWTALLAALAFLMVFLAASSEVLMPSLETSKYFYQVAMQALLLAVVLMTERTTNKAEPGEVSVGAIGSFLDHVANMSPEHQCDGPAGPSRGA